MEYGPFAKQLRHLGDLELQYLREVFERGRMSIFFNDGGMVERFQKAFAAYTGARAALARVNGMCGLAEAVSVSGAGMGTEVLCDPVVHFGGLAALYFNAVPRFVDIERGSYNMDPAALRKAITEHTKAVVCTHLWGQPARIDEISEICREHKLFLIEDCAHAVGVRWNGRHVGTFGDIGMFSFQEFKQLSTGDGCMLTLRDPELADKMENVWAFSGESPQMMTLNWRMNEMTAAVGLAQLQRVDEIVRKTYDVTLGIFEKAIAGCKWLAPRRVPKEATRSGYWFACTWEGDKHGLDYARFQKLNEEMGVGLRFGFNRTAPYEFDFFRKGNIYGEGCPCRCPNYLKKNPTRDARGSCPVVEDVMPRLVTVNLIFLSIDEAKRSAAKLQEAIAVMSRG